MADAKSTKTAKAAEVIEEINLDQKVTVKNIAGWEVGFARIVDIGDVLIMPEGSTRLSRNEIIAQVQNGNRLFVGIDGKGSHATLYIDDAITRKEIDFDSQDGKVKQIIFTDNVVSDLFKMAQSDFEKVLPETIKTRAEKYAIIQTIKKLKLNDYNKIRFIENYTGFKVQ